MSSGTQIPYHAAYELAQEVSRELTPIVGRMKAVGSLRRKVMNVGDLEFLVEPHFDTDLLGEKEAITQPIKDALMRFGTWLQGGERAMRITDLFGHTGVQLDLYIAHPPAEWGSLLAIRTGPRDLGVICVTEMRRRGFVHREGRVIQIRGRAHMPTPTEEDFFELAGVPCVPPSRRDELIQRLQGEKHARHG